MGHLLILGYGFRETEVSQLQVKVIVNHNIRWVQITMQDSFVNV
jgi:hypothetical protein